MKVVVVGAGLTGVCCAYELARNGHHVTVVDSGMAGGETTSASGSAVLYQTKETPLLVEMTRASMELWDDLARTHGAAFRRDGSHVLFSSAEEEAFVADRASFLAEQGVTVTRRTRAELSTSLPALHPAVTGGYHCAEDGEAHPFFSCITIMAAAIKAGARFHLGAVCESIETVAGRVSAVRTSEGEIACDVVVVAAGPLSAEIAAAYGLALPVFPERGEQLLTFPMAPTLTGRILSARYMLGKKLGAFAGLALGQEPDGRIKIGSTREPNEAELITSERGRQALLEELALCFPELAHLEIERHTVGLRSGSRTGRPIVTAPADCPSLIVIDGLGGNGVAFAPLIAVAVRERAEESTGRWAQQLDLHEL